ncbi:unnamed protein product [Paramecium pentaurelia]|uniref:Protein kinase domain-containing protein n=1 Tax=Paramecium pentaurelia TaxID=43138 RepID=A0A8S1X330_9CILI|nr:unnamed protein product [Paramecium pentaurelia]
MNTQQIQKQLVAKIYKNKKIPDDGEILKLKQLNHPNIVQIYDVYENEKDVIVIMEKCQSSLKNELKLKKEYAEIELLCFLSQILKGYNYLKNQGLEINELKPSNIMIDDNEMIKLSNYGMKYLYNYSVVDIRPYAAPEVFFSNLQTDAKNIYSVIMCQDIIQLGLIMYQLIFQQLPFSLKQNGDVIVFLQKIKKTKLSIPKNKFQKLTDMITEMIVYDHEVRIDIEKLGNILFQNFKRGSRRISSIQPIAAKADDYLYF